MRELLVVYCKGFAMGAADAVPGVSGGTIALIVGIYDRLIRALTAIDPRTFRAVARVYDAEGRSALLDALERTDAVFLVALGLGVASAIVVLSRVVTVAVETYPVPTYGFFFGLIAASAVVLYGQIDAWTPRRLVVSVLGVTLAALVTGATATGASHGPIVIFLAGAIAICAMVLPGVSGAFFLLVLGQYEYLAGVLSEFVDGVIALANGESFAPVIETGTVVAVFGVGAVIGLFTMAHVVRRALDRYRVATLAFLVSLMVGALRLPIERVYANLGDATTADPSVALAAAVAGAGAVVVLDRYTDDLEYVD
ncbi:DUF368 domain-containing protein [Natrialbaceae archaeon AArc-T1-2]|uniref:DUF368 domain-containing protein n=1 Tax=Natrialbaceae archaeon AArc-T1-2 TaxID=3053904 RepID=UPI00255AC02F|nr:DUF368 domain-containing protein [Natrialbaceae archaeon AArc-T1-2]WIV66234.1 DUF368 domain-containing protein [Natrialbaceae archaeon AArc-T1-2]